MDRATAPQAVSGPGAVASGGRQASVARALRLEVLTVVWNLAEGAIGVAAAIAAGSIALMGFGLDSFVESASGAILIWRLLAERTARDAPHIERLDRRAHRLVGVSLLLLASYIVAGAALALWRRETPAASPVGLALTLVSIGVMIWLARAKRRLARAMGSRALEADAFQTTACWWLSIATLAGLGLNAALGWWWADPAAAIAISALISWEGIGAWRGRACAC